MKKSLLLLALLACGAFAQTTVESTGTTTVLSTGSQTITNVYPSYYFFWDMNQNAPNFGILPQFNGTVAGGGSAVYEPDMQYFGAASLEANPNDSNNLWLHCELAEFPTAYAFNLSNNNIWGASLGKGWAMVDWMYTGTYVDEALVLQVNGKSVNASNPFDANDGIAIRTDLVGGGSTPGIDGISWVSPAQNTKYKIVMRWNLMTSNPTSTRTQIRYLIQSDGAQRKSGFNTGTIVQPKCMVWHHVLPGNDTPNDMEMWLKNLYVGGWWEYDLPVNVWQDFEFNTLSQANLESRDHNAFAVWQLGGTTTRFTPSTSAQKTWPTTINLWRDDGLEDPTGYTTAAGTRGMRDDLTATAAGHYGETFSNITTAVTYGFWFRLVGTLTDATSRQIAFNSEQSINNNILTFRVRSTSGQHAVLLRNSSNADSSAINISPNTWYWVTILAQRGTTCRARVYDSTGAQVGSEVTVSANAQSIGSIRFGSQTTSTAQAAGTFIDVDNFVYDINESFYPLKPWE